MTLKEKKQLKDLTIYWRKQLNLHNWKIKVRMLPWDKDDPSFGSTEISPCYERATIALSTPETIPADAIGIRDLEVTLVHELLHIRLVYVASLSTKPKKKWPLEMAIETIAQSLVIHRRGIKLEDLV